MLMWVNIEPSDARKLKKNIFFADFTCYVVFFGGMLTWPNKDDQMNLTESWQRWTWQIEFDQNWHRQT